MKPGRIAAMAAVLWAFLAPLQRAAAQTADQNLPVQAASVEEAPLSIFSGTWPALLTPAPLLVAPCPGAQASLTDPDFQKIKQEQWQRNHVEQIRKSLQTFQADKKHDVHLYLFDQSQLRGRIVAIHEDSFILRNAKNKAEVTLPLKSVSWVTKEPTGPQKFGHGLATTGLFILAAPVIVPFALLWWASGAD